MPHFMVINVHYGDTCRETWDTCIFDTIFHVRVSLQWFFSDWSPFFAQKNRANMQDFPISFVWYLSMPRKG